MAEIDRCDTPFYGARRIAVWLTSRGWRVGCRRVERLWRSLKHEEVSLKADARVAEARAGIGGWLRFCNDERFHQGLGFGTPRGVYGGARGNVDDPLRGTAALPPRPCHGRPAGKCSPSPTFPLAPPRQEGLMMT